MLKDGARQAIKEARYTKGLSRREVWELTGKRVSVGTIRNIELGENVETHLPQSIYLLAEALGLEPNDLVEHEVAS